MDLFLSRDAGGVGTVSIARFPTREAAQAWGGRPTPSTSSSSGAANLPNRSTVDRETVAGGVINQVWTQAGFLYATVRANKANVADIIIAGSFPLSAGEAENFYVGPTAAGFAATGTDGDILDMIEYGRV